MPEAERIKRLQSSKASLYSRIAELEAKVRAQASWYTAWQKQKRAREKAEAEVERLRKWIDETASALPLTQRSRLREALFHGVNPSGDTLGRKERDDGCSDPKHGHVYSCPTCEYSPSQYGEEEDVP